MTEINQFKDKRSKQDKKLAKEIAKWIDTAVTLNQKRQSEGDIPLDLIDDEDEDDQVNLS